MRKKNWIEFKNANNIENDKLKEENDYFYKNKQIKIYKEKKGKKGKLITVISWLGFEETLYSKNLLKKLKIFCGTGGKLSTEGIQLQGDMIERVSNFLRKDGYQI